MTITDADLLGNDRITIVFDVDRDTVADGVTNWQVAAKRAIDVAFSAVILLVLLPVFAVLAVAVVLTSGRPILFTQTRVGQHGRHFRMCKFRTMVPDAEARLAELAEHNERTGPLFKLDRDPRVTPVGRFLRKSSLDELPQLWNVLVGQMSLVGPRPALPEERDQFSPALLERETVPAGLTGLWQVDGRTSADFGKYTELDLRYVHTWSLGLDLRLIARTPFVLVAHALGRDSVFGRRAAA